MSGGSSGLTSSTADGGTLLSRVAGSPSYYEVRARLTLVQSGGVYTTMLRASPDVGFIGGAPRGSYYGFQLQYPVFSNGSCTGTGVAFEVVNGAATVLFAATIGCHNGMVVRAVLSQTSGLFDVYVDDSPMVAVGFDGAVVSGQPGVEVREAPAANGIAQVDLGQIETVPPPAIPPQSVQTSSFPTRIDMHWQGVVDNPGGSGLGFYYLYRNGVLLASMQKSEPSYEDSTVAPSTTYAYILGACDVHWNCTQIGFNASTPPPGAIDPRQIGVRPTGAYWGAAGEQIDLRAGNLNYSVPLLKAMGRGGWGVNFNLTYNSQNWRQDPAGIWQFGADVGYGYGWQLLAGALLPVYQDYWTVHHYIFTDSSGAQYRLDQNNNGVWSSGVRMHVGGHRTGWRNHVPDRDGRYQRESDHGDLQRGAGSELGEFERAH